jgi:hypothetical protein
VCNAELPQHGPIELAEERDQYGVRVARVTFNLHDNDKKLIEWLNERLPERGGERAPPLPRTATLPMATISARGSPPSFRTGTNRMRHRSRYTFQVDFGCHAYCPKASKSGIGATDRNAASDFESDARSKENRQ